MQSCDLNILVMSAAVFERSYRNSQRAPGIRRKKPESNALLFWIGFKALRGLPSTSEGL